MVYLVSCRSRGSLPITCKHSRPTETRLGASLLDQPLIHHRVRDLEEAGDVCAVHIIAGSSVLLRSAITNLVDRLHDVVETRVYFLARPRDAHAVLRHLETRSSDPARVRGLAGAEKDLRLKELIYTVDRRRHVRAF